MMTAVPEKFRDRDKYVQSDGKCSRPDCDCNVVGIYIKGGMVYFCPIHDDEKAIRAWYEY